MHRLVDLARRLPKKTFAVVFYGLLAIFLVLYLRSIDYSQLKEIQIAPIYFLVACVLGMMFRYWSAFVWISILRTLGARDVRWGRALLNVYAKSWMGRYIPGTAPWILGKIYFAAQHGISKNKLAVSSLLEGLLQIVVQMLFAVVMILLSPQTRVLGSGFRVLLLLAAVASLVVIAPPVFNRLVALAYRIVKRKEFPREHFVDTRLVVGGVGMYAIGVLFTGLSLFFIAKSVYPELPYESIFFVMGASCLASAASMIAIFAPGGIGVREGIQLVLLGLILPPSIALVITVIMRLWTLALDVLFFLLHARKHEMRPTSPPEVASK